VSAISNVGSVTNSVSVAIIGVSASCSVGTILGYGWGVTPDTPETWSAQSDTPETWSAISDTSESWTPGSDTSETWTAISDNAETWQAIA
jgi:hypothetical protein